MCICSVFLWIPPSSFCYPEIKVAGVKDLRKAEHFTSVAFMSGCRAYNESREMQRNTLYIRTSTPIREQTGL